ncbi:glutaredoxin [Candidatus Koribacter versatilis Ellin345]|uniref:Glutaredoxin n=1 Tax=Koribacter versatilis (strain Ellin345) TaxID=204669 RepID=Q1IPG9_KORVE|nr:glutaredoxin domain-containing protein [Candidatus Koribacter versatilis]ABF41231.1 glutaredoxin [Candidatus Koribacter versatilis Ellin345]
MLQPRITLFTRPDCPPCGWLKDWLRERNLEFEEYDVSVDKIAVFTLVRKYRSQSTPTLVIGEGEEDVLIGFEPEKIEAAIDRHRPDR